MHRKLLDAGGHEEQGRIGDGDDDEGSLAHGLVFPMKIQIPSGLNLKEIVDNVSV